METRELLEQVKSGKISIEEAESYFKREPFEEMGYARNWICIEKFVPAFRK